MTAGYTEVEFKRQAATQGATSRYTYAPSPSEWRTNQPYGETELRDANSVSQHQFTRSFAL